MLVFNEEDEGSFSSDMRDRQTFFPTEREGETVRVTSLLPALQVPFSI